MWKKIYFCALCLRFYWVFSPLAGYIHPDEFFQGPEKIAGDLFNFEVHTTWEFDESFPIRSPSIWYVLCGYPFWILRILKSVGVMRNLDSYWLLVTPRFMMALLTFLIDGAVMKIASLVGSRPYFAGCLSATSHVTVVFFTRTFSNSLEALFFSLVLVFACEYYLLCQNEQLTTKQEVQNTTKSSPSASSENGKIVKGEGETLELVSSKSDESGEEFSEKTKMGQLMENHSSDDSNSDHQSSLSEKSAKSSMVHSPHQKNKLGIIITVLVVAGIWNRPTFVGFACVPVLFWIFQGRRPTTVGDVLMATGRGLLNLPYIVNTALIFILFDTSYYRSKTPLKDYNVFDQFVVTPLNFLSYNRRSENLAQHGVHPRYLHALVNSPMLFGPLIAFVLLFPYMVSFVKRKDERNMLVMLFFSMVVPLGLLSIFPHQEARFIIPLLIPSIILSSYGLKLINSRALYAIFIFVWIPHNLFMGVMMGAFHQGGVVPSLLYLQAQKADGAFNGGATIVYHRTYMPPKSLLQLYKHESRFVKLIDLQTKVDDLELAEELMQYDTFYLVTPYSVNRLGLLLEDKFTIEMDASFYPHLSMEDPPELDEIVHMDSKGTIDWAKTLHATETSMSLNIYMVTNKKLIVQTFPSSGDFSNVKHNIARGAYETMAITLPKPNILSM